jgi:error-prone DNA polymerase
MHQAPPTAKGVHFLTLEDENQFINVVFRPEIYERYVRQIVQSPILVISGVVQREGDVINIVARRVEVWASYNEPLQTLAG